MRPLALVPILAALALAGCAGGSDEPAAQEETPTAAATTVEGETEPAAAAPPEEPGRLFTEDDLAELALQPSEAPQGMRYTRAESGPRTLEDAGIILEDQIAQAEDVGLSSIYDATFDSTTSDLRLSSRLWLFEAAAGAGRWLEKSRDDSVLYLDEVASPPLADASWAAQGVIGGTEVISHGFRSGNVVVVVTFSSNTESPSASQALALAQQAASRAESLR